VQEALLEGIAVAVDQRGGRFTMPYATVALTASRHADARVSLRQP
jgi:hypothetical protein